MNRRLPIVLLSAAALVALPATGAVAGGDHGSSKPGYSSGHDKGGPGKGQPGKGQPGTGQPGKGQPGTPSPAPTSSSCGLGRAGDRFGWGSYPDACDRATGYFLYEKKDRSKEPSFGNSGPQHRVALHPVWAWPSVDANLRHGAYAGAPRKAETIALELVDEDAAAVCADPAAYGLQVDLVGNGVPDRVLDLTTVVPVTITPPDGGFPLTRTLAYYGHYDVAALVDLDTLCEEDVAPAPAPVPPPAAEPTPSPAPSAAPTPSPAPSTEPTPSPQPSTSPEPTPSPAPEDEEVVVAPVPTPSPSPSERSEVLPAPAVTPTPTASAPAPSPTPSERSEVLSAGGSGTRAAVAGSTLAATGTQVTVGLLAALGAIAGGAALLVARRRHRAEV